MTGMASGVTCTSETAILAKEADMHCPLQRSLPVGSTVQRTKPAQRTCMPKTVHVEVIVPACDAQVQRRHASRLGITPTDVHDDGALVHVRYRLSSHLSLSPAAAASTTDSPPSKYPPPSFP